MQLVRSQDSFRQTNRFPCLFAGIDETVLENGRLFPSRPLDFVGGPTMALKFELLGSAKRSFRGDVSVAGPAMTDGMVLGSSKINSSGSASGIASGIA